MQIFIHYPKTKKGRTIKCTIIEIESNFLIWSGRQGKKGKIKISSNKEIAIID